MIYLLHFHEPYKHARHYTGYCRDGRLKERLAEHRSGSGARLIAVIVAAGIGFNLAKTWPKGTRQRERQLKKQGGASRHCPLCKKAAKK